MLGLKIWICKHSRKMLISREKKFFLNRIYEKKVYWCPSCKRMISKRRWLL